MICWTVFLLLVFLAAEGETLSILTVENHNVREQGLDDGWGEWGDWQPCSRSCGGGVTYMKRECLRTRSNGGPGPGCEGPDKMYTSCSIQDCPVHATDFRQLQCAQYNNITYRERTHQWIPYTGEAATNPCELFCQPRSGEFFLKLSDKVVDGTRCHETAFDVCVDGTCETVGCDMMLGSDLKSDICGECDGDGTSCYSVERSITAKLPSGYLPLITIPPGATQVHIYEKRASKNFLAIRDSGQKYILNGHWQINSSSVIKAAGSNIVYKKTSDRKRALESIEIKGPTSEMLYVDVLVQDRNRGIEYKFYLPHGTRDLNSGEHGWFAEGWQDCTAKCGGGLQKRKVVCKNHNIGERVLNYLCYAEKRPQSTKKCNTQPCGARWLIGAWQTCTKRCGGGVQTRQVNCIETREDSDSTTYLLSGDRCTTTIKPETQRECGSEQCPEWLVGEWTTCSVSCGDGIQRRQVECPSENLCTASPRPLSERACNIGPCSGIDWTTTDWSECTGQCENGFQTREVRCGTHDRVHYPENLCDASQRPTTVKSCISEILCPNTPAWVTEQWSDCSVPCGRGIQSRRVACALYETANYRILEDDYCRSSPKPLHTQNCLAQNCTSTWYIGTWGPCSVSCNGGVHSRVVLCVGQDDAVLADEACNENVRPTDSEDCNATPCESESEDTSSGPILPEVETVNPQPRGDETEHGKGEQTSTQESEICLLESDTGACEDWTVYWYFDTETRQCDRFWYGGCDGNKNRFESREDCSQTCREYISQETPSDTTTAPETEPPTTSTQSPLPPTTVSTTTPIQSAAAPEAPSEDPNSIPSFSPDFDVSHSPPKTTLNLPPPLCFLRKSTGPCNTRIPRWHFDGTTGNCVAFWYGGCGGNENNFASEENCVQICGRQPLPVFEQGLAEANTPPVPASIKPGRSEVSAEVDDMARLACMAEGSPEPTVTWRKLDQEIPDSNERSEVLEDHSLIISKIVTEDQGTYVCTASNGYGPEQTWEVKLIVKERLLIRETPIDTIVYVGEPAALRCRIHDDVLFFTWYKDGSKMQTDDYYYRIQPWGDLHILQAATGDSGVYTCTAYSPDASQSASAKLIVSQREQPTTTTTAVTTTSTISSSSAAKPTLRRPSQTERGASTKQCKDYPEYANCNIVVSKKMCHKHNYARYCCASCGGEPSTPTHYTRRRAALRRRNRR